MRRSVARILGAAAFAGLAPVALAATLDTVKARGTLACGINPNLPGFGAPDAQGAFRGINADFCRALAAAVLGDAGKVRFVPLTATARIPSLQSGDVDVLSHNTTWTMSRDTSVGLRLVGTLYRDGQSFLVKTSSGIKSARELSGASVCAQTGSTTELNLADYFRTHRMRYEPITFGTNDEATAAFGAGRCDALTGDASALLIERRKLPVPGAFAILPEVISKEPLGPMIRKGDDGWFDVVRWTLFALINAEELGITRENADTLAQTGSPEARRLLGSEGQFGKALGLDEAWALRAIKAVGHYGEVFEANLGSGSQLRQPRGVNALWRDGGLLDAPPVR